MCVSSLVGWLVSSPGARPTDQTKSAFCSLWAHSGHGWAGSGKCMPIFTASDLTSPPPPLPLSTRCPIQYTGTCVCMYVFLSFRCKVSWKHGSVLLKAVVMCSKTVTALTKFPMAFAFKINTDCAARSAVTSAGDRQLVSVTSPYGRSVINLDGRHQYAL